MITATDRPKLTVLRAAWLFDGLSDTLTPDPTVVIDGGTIIEIDRVPEHATVVELAGATLLPGLVDTHVHLAFDASEDPIGNLAARDDAAALAAMTSAAQRAARGGVTTVRDLGDRGYLSLALRDAAVTDHSLPTIVAAGPPLTTPGGHCYFLGGEAKGVDGLRAIIRAHVEHGVDVIKIMASGGNMTPGSRPELNQFDRAELQAAVDEAHRHGLPITAHGHGLPAIVDAVAAGVDGLEHASFMSAEGVDTPPDDLLKAIVDQGIAVSSTVGLAPGAGQVDLPVIFSRLPALRDNARLMVESGALVVAGSDAGIAPFKPHDVLRWAVGQLDQIGMAPLEALRASTSVAAGVCGLGDRKGRIAPGFDADILAVDGNPLEDPTVLHQLRAIYVRGTEVVPSTSVAG